MAIVNNIHKKAAKAAAARMVVHGTHHSLVGWSLAGAIMEHGLQVGDLGTTGALTHYAAGVERQGEKASNRRWQEYGEIRALADKLVKSANKEIEDYLM
jgi:hypothetical protein